VQVVWSSRRGPRSIEHVGSAHDESELEALKAAARQRLVQGKGEFDLGLDLTGIAGTPLQIVGSRAGHAWDDALRRAYEVLGLDRAAGGDAGQAHPPSTRKMMATTTCKRGEAANRRQ
jgi:hypothetical protein